MDLIDSHAHVDVSDYDADREGMLERARAAGVSTLLAIGNGPEVEKLGAAVSYAQAHDWIYASAGIHPHEAKHATDAHYAELDRLARLPCVIAWGEIGLDFHYDHSPRDVQARVFRHQLGQARAVKLPVIIHCREAWPDCLKILTEEWRSSGLGGIFHCFGGTLEEAHLGMDMGFLISFAGNVTYPKAQNLRDVALEIPLDQMLVETDSPFLAPQPYRGRRNEPAYVAEVARTIGNVRDLPATRVAEVTSANFRRFFGLNHSGTRTGAVQGGLISLLTAKEIFDLVRDDLVKVERELALQNGSAIEPVAEISRYLLAGGGKRLRPALLLLSAGYAGYRGDSAIRLGAVVELIHSATLIHDDVIDGANTRRGRPSANSRWGNHRSVLAGDWLYMQSFQMALAERNFKILDVLIELTQNMVEGELLQLTKLGRMDLTEQDAVELAARKTACLFAGCARLGAVLGKMNEAGEQAMADYGHYAGLAFQLVDDLLDFTASPEKLGKPVLSDLKEGKVTLPLIYALESDGASGKRLVSTVLEEKGFESVRPEQITALVQESGALDRTRAAAHDFACRAKACLNGNGTSDFGRALLTVPDFILERDN